MIVGSCPGHSANVEPMLIPTYETLAVAHHSLRKGWTHPRKPPFPAGHAARGEPFDLKSGSTPTMDHLPLIDLRAAPDEVAQSIGRACRAHGFFYVVGHGIDESLGQRLEDAEPPLLRSSRRDQGTVRNAARRSRLARLVSARRRIDLRPARLERRSLPRHRAGRGAPARGGGCTAPWPQPHSRRRRAAGTARRPSSNGWPR